MSMHLPSTSPSSTTGSVGLQKPQAQAKAQLQSQAQVALYDEKVEQQKKIGLFTQLRREIPSDDCGIPKYLYRADYIHSDILLDLGTKPEDKQTILRNATIDVNYREGFPSLPDGTPLWAQWDFEPDDLHNCFCDYLELPDHVGIRSLNDLKLLSTNAQHISKDTLTEAFTYFFWDDRARAHDLYKAAAAQKMRERRILSTNNRHYLESDRLLTRLYKDYFEKIDEDTGQLVWIDQLTPKDAIKALETLTTIQRRALGLGTNPQGGAGSGDDSLNPFGSPSTSDTLRNAMRKINERNSSSDSERKSDSDDIIKLLNNEDAAEGAQKLIVQLNAHRNKDREHIGAANAASSHSGGASDGLNESFINNVERLDRHKQKQQEHQEHQERQKEDHHHHQHQHQQGQQQGSGEPGPELPNPVGTQEVLSDEEISETTANY